MHMQPQELLIKQLYNNETSHILEAARGALQTCYPLTPSKRLFDKLTLQIQKSAPLVE